ncbi:MAG: hypothetical protein M1825_005324 [Sarcosagium campestre]|nr:MAG: hypothetical protein M1825_005324 [Sarcosagium campestre]
MASPALTPSAAPSTNGLEDISKPPAGVVLPPKDIRAVLEKTAGYVARNGTVFEDRIRDKEKNNPKFSFLSPNDAYSAFYHWRLAEIREGRGTAISAGRAGEAVKDEEEEKPKGPPEPPAFHFSARMPNINAQDLDVVRLTALFVAKNGKAFTTTLSQRETGNYQFDFLRPNHSLYQFFTRMVDQYTELIRASGIDGEGGKVEKEKTDALQKNLANRLDILERSRARAEWARFQEKQKQIKEEEEQKEKLAYAQVDWHDFVVVETVLFDDADDQAELPAPTSLSDLQSASLEQKGMMSLQPHSRRLEEAMPTADDSSNYYNPHAPSASTSHLPPKPLFPMPPPTIPAAATARPPGIPAVAAAVDTAMGNTGEGRAVEQEDEEAQRIRERADAMARAQQAQAEARGGVAPMKIRSDYVPRAAAQAASRRGVQMLLCPNCKQQIPYNELDEHMRIELLDPRWKEQRAKADSRFSTTNLSTADVANNLKRLASQRSDVFDVSASTPSGAAANSGAGSGSGSGGAVSDEETARRKRVALSYDGQPDASREVAAARLAQLQTANVEEQIRQLHEKYGHRST